MVMSRGAAMARSSCSVSATGPVGMAITAPEPPLPLTCWVHKPARGSQSSAPGHGGGVHIPAGHPHRQRPVGP